MSKEDENNVSDDQEDYDPKKHKQLLQSISRLGKTQHIQKPSRSEPVLKQDEFHLSKTGKISQVKAKETAVSVNDLVSILNKTNHHVEVGKELKSTQWSKKVLPKPLEKPEADRIQRTIGYEKTKKKLKKWDPVVARNRLSDHQVFPLDYEEIHVDTTAFSKKGQSKISVKSDLQIEMEALEEKLKELKGIKKDTNDPKEEERRLQQKLTKNELIAKRREMTYLRIQQSQKSAKARLHKKIKSKKFHKLMKKEKLKEQLKEFEQLQKSNPDAAIEQLEKLEKSRVLERASLRHKNTGTWAKNLQVRAKYDRDVRKDLAEQLAVSRELTQKRHESSEDEDQDKESDAEMGEENRTEEVDPFNPWVKASNKNDKTDESDELLTGYKKYWLERNENAKVLKEYEKLLKEVEAEKNLSNDKEIENSGDEKEINEDISKFKKMLEKHQESDIGAKELKKKDKAKILKRKSLDERNRNTPKLKDENKKRRRTIENGWVVEEIENTSITETEKLETKNIDDIFDEAEDEVQHKLSKKAKNVREMLKELEKSGDKSKNIKSKIKEKDELKNLKDLSFKSQKQRPEIDEALSEVPLREVDKNDTSLPKLVKERKERNKDEIMNGTLTNGERQENGDDLIDPNNFANIKPKRLHTMITTESAELFNDDVGDENETDPDLSRQMTIAEAFEDDDVIADFKKEKEDVNKQDNEIDLTLPGWGSWAGSGIKSKPKKRLVLKFPEKEKRRDENKGNVYINENATQPLKDHLVSDLPFPFTSVKDYEASIRAPLGRTFVPETAFRILTRPAVQTKMGHIIEPMNESILVKKPFTRRKHPVDVKIQKMLGQEAEAPKVK